ncbi:hypothetical protein NB694_003918 [Pantoea ananatis]|uniref:hypothetical protein n=1 Tax=Pantoea ananas TaxID=553 RepID=UPI0021F73CEA|nr:hypothetical protein [Pantoea ananatis]MCW0314118.1 hypothetical protein [Pantoea ananatis]
MLTVFNCGQGDASKLENEFCVFDSNSPLYIDLGPSTFTCNVNTTSINLLITHSHDDHVCGVFKNSNQFIIDNLYIPAYFPEIYKIKMKLLKKTMAFPLKFRSVHLLYENSSFGSCQHMEVLNPPLNPNEIFSKKDTIFIEDEDIAYFLRKYDTSIDDIINQDTPFDGLIYPEGYSERLFVLLAVGVIMKLTKNGNVPINKAYNRFIEYDANKISVVFKFYDHVRNLVYLLTGDADRSVFNRLIKKKTCLKANALKVPHHGSIKNLSKRILSKISPSVAIISHDNGKFGKAKDTHPNSEVIKLLNKQSIDVYYTNDVKKNGSVIYSLYTGTINSINTRIV